MSKFIKAIETLKRWIGVDKRSGDDRRIKKPRKRKNEKRLDQRRKKSNLHFHAQNVIIA